MKKIAVLSFALLGLLACKDKSAKNEAMTHASNVVADTPLKTYAEISIKEGGEWMGRKYVGGDGFRNVQALCFKGIDYQRFGSKRPFGQKCF